MRYVVRFEGEVAEAGTRGDVDADALAQHLDDVAEALLELGAEDPDVGGILARGDAHVGVTVEAPSPGEALTSASLLIETAVRRAGGIFPEVDMEAIRAMGIDGVFGPGTNTSDIIAFIRENAGPRTHAA